MKKYVEKYDRTFKVQVYYDLGGMNYFIGEVEPRGYYFSVTPVVVTNHESGGRTEVTTAFSGTKKCIYMVSRKSAKSLKDAEAIITDGAIDEMIDYVAKKNRFDMGVINNGNAK